MSEAIFTVPNFEARAIRFAESMLERLWAQVLSSADDSTALQLLGTQSYESFIDLIKARFPLYYEATQLAFHGCDQHSSTNVYDTPGRQFEEDYAEFVKRYDPYQVVTD